MPGDSRLLYLVRHAEPTADGDDLSARGVKQAELLGRRLSALPVSRVVHGPLPRAARTARILSDGHERDLPVIALDEAGDYLPHVPRDGEVPEGWAEVVRSSFAGVMQDEVDRGAQLGQRALEVLAGTAGDGRGRLDVVVTHAFTIGWLLARALGGPAWRWWGLDQCHAGVTVLRYDQDRPPAVVVANDTSHLPPALRWTGIPDVARLPG